jgi:hypothetical protein
LYRRGPVELGRFRVTDVKLANHVGRLRQFPVMERYKNKMYMYIKLSILHS